MMSKKKRKRRRMKRKRRMMTRKRRMKGEKEGKKDQIWNGKMEREKRDLVWGLRDCMPDGEESEVENWKAMKRVTRKVKKRP